MPDGRNRRCCLGQSDCDGSFGKNSADFGRKDVEEQSGMGQLEGGEEAHPADAEGGGRWQSWEGEARRWSQTSGKQGGRPSPAQEVLCYGRFTVMHGRLERERLQ